MFLPVPLSLICLRDGFTHPLHPLLASARCATEAAVPAAMGIQQLGLIGLMILSYFNNILGIDRISPATKSYIRLNHLNIF